MPCLCLDRVRAYRYFLVLVFSIRSCKKIPNTFQFIIFLLRTIVDEYTDLYSLEFEDDDTWSDCDRTTGSSSVQSSMPNMVYTPNKQV